MNVGWRESDPTSCPSVYFSAPYGTAAGLTTGAWWASIRSDDDAWQVPLNVRPIEGGGSDAATPYGYGGIHAAEAMGTSDVTDAWRSTLEVLGEAGIVSLFLRFSPFWPGQTAQLEHLDGLTVISTSQTVEVPVEDLDAAWGAMEGRSRTAVRKAGKAGLTAAVAPATTALRDPGHAFRRLYDSTMERLGAAPHHRHPDAYYEILVEGCGERIEVVEVRGPDGDVVAACLLLLDDDVVHYHLAGSEPAAARLGANNLMVWTMLERASRSGRSRAHLGGGTGPDDGLFRFKRSFGGEVRDFSVGHVVVRPDAYRRLVDRRAEALGVRPDDLAASGFFPAYRSA
jgi:serine/alanine adding enzyme